MNIKEIYKRFLDSNGVCTDTRKLEIGCMFFALKGDNFDGNEYAANAIKNGAKYSVVDDPKVVDSPAFILVDDVLSCLQELSTFHRQQFGGKVLALTGSNGKTTSKELISKVLASTYTITNTQGNLNNHIGVPLTLLSASITDDFVIVEMGANHQLEIKLLCEIAQPDIGLITNIGKAHLEGFGGVEGVIKGKSEMYDYLKLHKKPIIVNGDDDLLMGLLKNYVPFVVYNKVQFEQEVSSTFVAFTYKSEKFKSQLIGQYQLDNLALAIRVGELFGIPLSKIKNSIEAYIPNNNRSEITKLNGVTVLLDAYNANPTSMQASIAGFKKLNFGSKGFILGDMLELGEYAMDEHKAIVESFSNEELSNVIFIGKYFSQVLDDGNYQVFQDLASAQKSIETLLNKVDAVLLKGSRGLQLERIVNFK